MALKPASLSMRQNLAAASTPHGAGAHVGSDGDRAPGSVERDGQQARSTVRRNEREVDEVRGLVSRQAEPLADTLGVAGDLQATDGDVGRCPGGRVRALVVPLDVERQLRVSHESHDTELTPLELDTVRAAPAADYGLTTKSLLSLRQVFDSDDPSQPATAELGTGADRLTERALVGGGVVKHLDNLHIAIMGQGKNDVAGAEAGWIPPST